MSTKRKYKVTIISDADGEKFSTSNCNCISCQSMHIYQREWDTFIPTTKLQLSMKKVVKSIIKRNSRS